MNLRCTLASLFIMWKQHAEIPVDCCLSFVCVCVCVCAVRRLFCFQHWMWPLRNSIQLAYRSNCAMFTRYKTEVK
jgi:hypothetical protein